MEHIKDLRRAATLSVIECLKRVVGKLRSVGDRIGAKRKGIRLLTDAPPPWSERGLIEAIPVYRAQVQAAAVTSLACAEGGTSVRATLAAFARGVASVGGGGCIIRPRVATADCPARWAPVAAHVTQKQQAVLRQLKDRHSHAFASAFSARVGQTGQPVFMPNVLPEFLRMWSEPAAWPYVEQFEPCSIIAVSVGDQQDVIGSLVVWRDAPAHPFIEHDLAFAEHIAERLKLVVASAR
jgi:GAF domain-containing protein